MLFGVLYSDKRMVTITAGVNLLNNKLHDYQTENARELANQRARVSTLEQAKVVITLEQFLLYN